MKNPLASSISNPDLFKSFFKDFSTNFDCPFIEKLEKVVVLLPFGRLVFDSWVGGAEAGAGVAIAAEGAIVTGIWNN